MSETGGVKKIVITADLLKETELERQTKANNEVSKQREERRQNNNGEPPPKKKCKREKKVEKSRAEAQSERQNTKEIHKDDDNSDEGRKREQYKGSPKIACRSSQSPPRIRNKKNIEVTEIDLNTLVREILETVKRNWIVYK